MAATVRTEPTPLPTTSDPFRDLARQVEDREAALAVASVWADPDRPADDAPEEPAGSNDESLPPTDVLLSDGRIVRLRRTRGVHDLRMGRMLSRWGMSVQAVGADTFAEIKALLTIESIRQQGQDEDAARPFRTPNTQERLEFELGQFYTADLLKLVVKYAELNMGIVQGGAGGDGDGRAADNLGS